MAVVALVLGIVLILVSLGLTVIIMWPGRVSARTRAALEALSTITTVVGVFAVASALVPMPPISSYALCVGVLVVVLALATWARELLMLHVARRLWGRHLPQDRSLSFFVRLLRRCFHRE